MEVIEALEPYKLPILNSYTSQRVIYPTSASEGKTVFIEQGFSDATLEIDAIRDEIIGVLNGTKN
jgi:chromosome partitioning protein